MIKLILLMLFVFCYCNQAYSQDEYKTTNYYGVEYFSLITYNSDDAENLKDIFLDEAEIKKQIAYKTGLKELLTLSKDNFYKEVMIQIGYQIYKNPYAEEQYYGGYEIRIMRVLKIPNSDYITTPHAQIFLASNSFVTNYPIKSVWKKEIKVIIETLIDKFALDFKSSY